MSSSSARPGVAPLRVMSALAVELAFKRSLVPAFEAATGRPVEIVWDPTTVLMRRIGEGERADAVVLIDSSMDKLVAEGLVRPQTRVSLADAVLGLAVRQGAPKPDISTLAAFKTALTDARSIAYSRGGASGIYFGGLIERLGLAETVNARATTIAAGFTAEKLVTGEADLAVQQISELMSVEGVDIVGPFPDEVQVATPFSAAIFTDAASPEDAAAFLATLVGRDADSAYRRGGLVSRLAFPGTD